MDIISQCEKKFSPLSFSLCLYDSPGLVSHTWLAHSNLTIKTTGNQVLSTIKTTVKPLTSFHHQNPKSLTVISRQAIGRPRKDVSRSSSSAVLRLVQHSEQKELPKPVRIRFTL